MPSRVIYFLMLALLFTHEIDAAFRHEWRVLPITSFLPDELGREVFIWLMFRFSRSFSLPAKISDFESGWRPSV